MASSEESVIPSDSPSSSSDYQPPEKSTSRGKRGGKGRGRGASRGRAASKKTATQSKGVGKSASRGKRKKTGAFQLTDEEWQHLQRQKLDIKSRAREMVQGLSESAAKDVLCSAAEAIPALILNIMEKFQEETAAKSPEPGPAPTKPSWCICNNCRETLPEDVRVCCGFRPNLCQSIIPEIHLITDINVLTMQRLYRNDVFARHNATEEEYNKAMRHAAYRQYILFEYGRLGRGVRRPVPSCVTWFIRDKFPDSLGHYVPYVPSW